MAEFVIQSETLDNIADAINAKTGGSSAMTPAQMVTAIASIPIGGGLPSQITKITTGTLVLTSDATEVTITHNLGVRPSLFYFAPYALDMTAIRTYNKGKTFSCTYSNIGNVSGSTGIKCIQYVHTTSGNLLPNASSQLWADISDNTIKISSANSSAPYACQYTDSNAELHDITWLFVAVAIDWGW